MKWINVDKEQPKDNKRILIYSPDYKDIDGAMLFRIIDSKFLKIITDAKYWTYLSPPEEEDTTRAT